jgi:hypothetical protein
MSLGRKLKNVFDSVAFEISYFASARLNDIGVAFDTLATTTEEIYYKIINKPHHNDFRFLETLRQENSITNTVISFRPVPDGNDIFKWDFIVHLAPQDTLLNSNELEKINSEFWQSKIDLKNGVVPVSFEVVLAQFDKMGGYLIPDLQKYYFDILRPQIIDLHNKWVIGNKRADMVINKTPAAMPL